jgi:putative ABC transport system permease protein
MRALINIFAQVFRSIGANKLRSFLTMFGIAWGVASLLLLIGLGEGFRSGQRRGLAELGTDVIMMWGGTIPVLPEQHVGMRPYKLTMSDAAAIRAQAPDVRNVTSIINRSDLKQVSDFSSAGGQVLGVELNYPTGSCAGTENGWAPVSGTTSVGRRDHAEWLSVSSDRSGKESRARQQRWA